MFRYFFFLIFCLSIMVPIAEARPMGFEVFKGGKLSSGRFTPKYSAEKYMTTGKLFLEKKNYREALTCFLMIKHHFPQDPLASEATLLAGKSYLKRGQYDLAEQLFSEYLTKPNAVYSQDLFEMKLQVAMHYALGYRKHMFNLEGFPRLENGDQDAFNIYNEVLAAHPFGDLGAVALYHKGELHRIRKEYDEALKTYQKLTKQFPSHALAIESYVAMSKIYLILSLPEPHNTTYLSLAKANMEKFEQKYAGHPSGKVLLNNIRKIEERQAEGLYYTGQFYEKKKKPKAARIYYDAILSRYPETSWVAKSDKRLARLSRKARDRLS